MVVCSQVDRVLARLALNELLQGIQGLQFAVRGNGIAVLSSEVLATTERRVKKELERQCSSWSWRWRCGGGPEMNYDEAISGKVP